MFGKVIGIQRGDRFSEGPVLQLNLILRVTLVGAVWSWVFLNRSQAQNLTNGSDYVFICTGNTLKMVYFKSRNLFPESN